MSVTCETKSYLKTPFIVKCYTLLFQPCILLGCTKKVLARSIFPKYYNNHTLDFKKKWVNLSASPCVFVGNRDLGKTKNDLILGFCPFDPRDIVTAIFCDGRVKVTDQICLF